VKRWGPDGEGSGTGSSRGATVTTRALLEMLVYRHGVTRVLDAPCGTAHWWPPLLARLRAFVPCLEYHGVDVVPSVIAANTAKHAGDARTTFALADLSTATLPRDYYDLSLTRDALQHLPLLDAIDVIAAIARARPRLALFGSYLNTSAPANREIVVGDFYTISLLRPPFLMGETLDVLDENVEKKSLLLYSGEYLASLDFDAMRARAVRDFGAKRAERA
jgi:SAM-dependent methyltransferase